MTTGTPTMDGEGGARTAGNARAKETVQNRERTRLIVRKQQARRTRVERRTAEEDEIAALRARIDAGAQYSTDIVRFADAPLSSRTQRGLSDAHFVEMTDVQRAAVPPALAGLDVCAAAKTGSGKTLAFLVPLVERLYVHARWAPGDGMGALVLSPTRELALQTFEVLRRVGRHHTSLSAGLVIGGKSLEDERAAIGRMAIVVATPGRLLQHLDTTVGLEWASLAVLVLDEADRMLDLGFAPTVDAIMRQIGRTPGTRQTMLFSATQASAAAFAARLGVDAAAVVHLALHTREVTPERLAQHYVRCPLAEKMDRLWSHIKANLGRKTLVFFASCKQVRFAYEAFCRLQPGVPLLHLLGRQKQARRTEVFRDFAARPAAVLFATDVAARGLDFAGVDWVVQADCPEDVDTYVHRVGRAARNGRAGSALLLLTPGREQDAFLAALAARGVPIANMYTSLASPDTPAPAPKRPVAAMLEAACSSDPQLKYLAQKALVTHVRSLAVARDKTVFAPPAPEDIAAYARSLGLAAVPRLRFLGSKTAKNAVRGLLSAGADSDDSHDEGDAKTGSRKNTAPAKVERMFRRQNTDVLSSHYAQMRGPGALGDASASDAEDDLLVVKRTDSQHDTEELERIARDAGTGRVSRRDILQTRKRAVLRTSDVAKTHVRFTDDEDGLGAVPVVPYARLDPDTPLDSRAHMHAQAQSMRLADADDAERARTIRREKRRRLAQRRAESDA